MTVLRHTLLAIYCLVFQSTSRKFVGLQFMNMSNLQIDDRRIQCHNLNGKKKGCRLSGGFPSQCFPFSRFFCLRVGMAGLVFEWFISREVYDLIFPIARSDNKQDD